VDYYAKEKEDSTTEEEIREKPTDQADIRSGGQSPKRGLQKKTQRNAPVGKEEGGIEYRRTHGAKDPTAERRGGNQRVMGGNVEPKKAKKTTPRTHKRKKRRIRAGTPQKPSLG